MDQTRPDLLALLVAGLNAADPSAAVQRVVRQDDEAVVVGDRRLETTGHLQVLALGKASLAMVEGLAAALPDLTLHGLAVAPGGRSEVRGVVTVHGDHPVPGLGSIMSGQRLLAAAAITPPHVPTIVLVSGGGSALAEALVPEVSLEWMAAATDLLLRRGATIDELNAVRRHVSLLKGGGLAAALRGPYATVVLSDVVGSPLHVIASGPTVPDPTSAEELADIAGRYGIDLPPVHRSDAAVPSGPFVVAADCATAASAAVTAGEAVGHRMVLHTTELGGEARDAAVGVIAETEPGTVGVFAGETTVTVRGEGLGGRNQEAALAAALEIEGTTTRFAALGTDGIDGRSPAAGAFVDGESTALIRSAGLDPAAALRENDSHTVLSAIDATITTGPTGTNVGDVWLVDRSSV